MTNILIDLSDEKIREAIETNCIENIKCWAKWEKMDLVDTGDMFYTMTDVPFPFFNNVFRSSFPAEEADENIHRIICETRRRKVPLFWWALPSEGGGHLINELEQQGFTHLFEAPAMAMDLRKLPLEDRTSTIPVVFEEVSDTEGLSDWCRVMTCVYEFPEHVHSDWKDLLQAAGYGKASKYRHFIARSEGEPVACSSIYLDGRVAGLSNVGTMPEYRRRGLGRAIVLTAFNEARSAGYRVGVLYSSEMGYEMYKQMGFREYSRGNCFLLDENLQ